MKTIQSKIILVFTVLVTLVLGLILYRISSVLNISLEEQRDEIYNTIERSFENILSKQLFLLDLKITEKDEQTENFLGYLASSETITSNLETKNTASVESFLNLRDNHYLLDYILIFDANKQLVATYPKTTKLEQLNNRFQDFHFSQNLFTSEDPTLFYSALTDLTKMNSSFLEDMNLSHFISNHHPEEGNVTRIFGQLILNDYEEPIGFIVAGYFFQSLKAELDHLSSTVDMSYFIHNEKGNPIAYKIPGFAPKNFTSANISTDDIGPYEDTLELSEKIENQDYIFNAKILRNKKDDIMGFISTAYSFDEFIKEEESIVDISSEAIGKVFKQIVIISLITLFVFYLVAFIVGKRIGSPILRLAQNMKMLAAGDYGIKIIGTKQSDEIGEMARTVKVFQQNAIEKKALEDDLKQSEERYALAAKGTNDGLWDWDIEKNSLYVSPRWSELLGYKEKDKFVPSMQDWMDKIHPDDLIHFEKSLANQQKGKTEFLNETYRIQKKDGEYIWVLTRGVAIFNKKKKAIRIAGSQTDITIQKKNEEKLYHDAFHDNLTGLPNRALFIDRLSQSLLQYKRDKSNKFAVLFLDLDNFKGINDTFGHEAGDDYIIEFGKQLKKSCRETDTVSRFGGDEFSVLVNNVKSLEDIKTFCDSLKDSIYEPILINAQEIYPTASIGVAFVNDDYKHSSDILRDADFALYRAKFNGKNRYEVFDEKMRLHAANLFKMEHDLKNAVTKKEVFMLYQPIVDIKTRDIIGFESLMRWQHPEFGLVSPAEFIPLAEETNMISNLTDFAIKESTKQLKKWHDKFSPKDPWFVSVNVSAKQLDGDDIVEALKKDLKKAKLSPEYLKVEITETFLMSDPNKAVKLLEGFQALGIKVLIDDFGTGYSSLGHIHKFSFDGIKIDQSFVQDIDTKPKSQKMVELISHMAQFLSMRTVVEGIETERELDAIKELHCDYGQGYLFSRPVSAKDAQKLLEEEMKKAKKPKKAKRKKVA